MEDSTKLVADNEIVALREGVKNRYQFYHRRDSLRFPMFEFNTNRANYEPLRESFEEEFFIVRGIDRQQKTIHIPSTTTLALLFTDDSYVPSQKIWNTCWSYGEGQVKTTDDSTETASVFPMTTSDLPRRRSAPAHRYKWLILVGAGLLVGLFLGMGVNQYLPTTTFKKSELAVQNALVPNRLKISRPNLKDRVPPTFVVSGLANPKETVWLVTHFQDTDLYWVQFPALVDHRGFWVEVIEIAGAGFDRAGRKHELRAFVNPINELKVSDVLHSWPKAERSTGVVEIIMDPKAPFGNYGN